MLQQEVDGDAGMATDSSKQAGGADYWYQRYVEHSADPETASTLETSDPNAE